MEGTSRQLKVRSRGTHVDDGEPSGARGRGDGSSGKEVQWVISTDEGSNEFGLNAKRSMKCESV